MVSSAFRVLLVILLRSLALTLFSVLKALSLSAVLTGMTISTDASSLMLGYSSAMVSSVRRSFTSCSGDKPLFCLMYSRRLYHSS